MGGPWPPWSCPDAAGLCCSLGQLLADGRVIWSSVTKDISVLRDMRSQANGFESFKCFGSSIRSSGDSEKQSIISAFFISLWLFFCLGKGKIITETAHLRSHNVLIPMGIWGQNEPFLKGCLHGRDAAHCSSTHGTGSYSTEKHS